MDTLYNSTQPQLIEGGGMGQWGAPSPTPASPTPAPVMSTGKHRHLLHAALNISAIQQAWGWDTLNSDMLVFWGSVSFLPALRSSVPQSPRPFKLLFLHNTVVTLHWIWRPPGFGCGRVGGGVQRAHGAGNYAG